MADRTWQIKERIKRSFSRGAETYDTYGELQREVAGEVLSLLKGRDPEMVLDVGCGTGFLTQGLKELFPYAKVVACDLSHRMAVITKAKVQGIHPTTGDCEYLPYRDGSFDLVVSSLTYQWAIDVKGAFVEAFRVLKPGGDLVLTILGKESLRELRESYRKACATLKMDGLPSLMEFLSIDRVLGLLEGSGFQGVKVWSTSKARRYRDMWTLLRTLKGIGAANPLPPKDPTLGGGRVLKEMARVYSKSFSISGSVTATYEVIFARGRK